MLTGRIATVVSCASCACALALSACSPSTGEYAVPIDALGQRLRNPRSASGLVISGIEDPVYASPSFGLVVMTIENTTDDWVRIDHMGVSFAGGVQGVEIPSGERLVSWAQATADYRPIPRDRAAIVYGNLGLATFAVAHLEEDTRRWQHHGLADASAVLETQATAEASEASTADKSGYPPGHLLATPFSIPPNMSVQRWIVFQTPSHGLPCLDMFLLDYVTASAAHERAWLRFRSVPTSSMWQDKACPHPVTNSSN